MSRLIVVDTVEGTRVPFLRGILTRSLTQLGVEFDDAYKLATELRHEFVDGASGEVEVTTTEIRQRVVSRLKSHGKDFIERYRHPTAPEQVMIRMPREHAVPFSRGRTRQTLLACGIDAENAARAAEAVYARLLSRDQTEIAFADLQRLTYERLEALVSETAARSFLTWTQFQNSDRPLIILIGGTAGCGKSTVTTEIAHRLEIVRTQSSDMLREVMRMMLPKRLLPVLHASSFNAARATPMRGHPTEDDDDLLAEGYLTQTQLVSVACEAVLDRALGERVSLIIEGVHVHPSLIDRIPEDSDAIVVTVMLALLKKTRLMARIIGRGKEAPKRRAKRYLAHFDSIWRLQSFLLSEADAAQVPIVQNLDVEHTVQQVLGIVQLELAKHFTGTPDEVFS